MKTDPGHIAANATSLVSRPCAKLEIYWSSSWSDETQYLLAEVEGTATLGTDPMALGQNAGSSLRVQLDNSSGRFSLSKSGSPANVYGIFGKRVRFSAGYYHGSTPEYVTVFTGRIVEVVESQNPPIVTLNCAGEEVLASQQKIVTPLGQGFRTDEWIGYIATQIGIASMELERGLITHPYLFADNDNALDEMISIALAEAGIVFFDYNATLRYWAATHWCNASSVATFDQNDYANLVPLLDYAGIVNEIACEYQPFELGASTVVYSLTSPIYLAPGETRQELIKFDSPAGGSLSWTLYASAGGEDMSSSISCLLDTQYATCAQFSLTNNHSFRGAWITQFDIVAKPLLGKPAGEVLKQTESAVRKRRDIRGLFYITSRSQAEMLANLALARLTSPRRGYQLQGLRANPLLNLGDVITIIGDNDLVVTAIITGIRWAYSTTYTMDIVALDAGNFYSYSDYLRIGSTPLGSGRIFY